MPADVAERGGAEERIAHRVDEDVGVGVPREAFFERYRHPAEDELPALHQRVHIVSLADPHDTPLSIFSAISRSAGKVTFMFFVLPSTSFGL